MWEIIEYYNSTNNNFDHTGHENIVKEEVTEEGRDIW